MIDLSEEVFADTSVILNIVLRDAGPLQDVADDLGAAFGRGAPSLLLLDLSLYELVNALVRRHRMDGDEAGHRLADLYELADMVVRIDPALASRAAVVAAETDLSGYDAAFVAAAERMDLPLITSDDRTAAASPVAVHLRDLASA